MLKGLYWYWYFLAFIFILVITNVNCETADQTIKITRTGEICKIDRSNAGKVITRTSTMFKYNIAYSCYINKSWELAVFRNNKIETQCSVKTDSRNAIQSIVSVTCNDITNNGGRNWAFTFGSKYGSNQTIENQTFLITLQPFPLKGLPNFDITLNEELTSASIFIPNCNQTAETKYLILHCQNDNNETKSLSDNCTSTCLVKSGSVYNISLVRSSIPRYNGIENVNDTFPIEQRTESIRIGKACNSGQSSGIKLMKRTWNMFMCQISYDCLIINPAKLAVFRNTNIATQCKLNLTYSPVIEKTNVIITCDNIENNAGRNWEFLFGSINDQKSNVINETFIVTLEPFPLNKLPNFNKTFNENITSVSIFIPQCDQVAEIKYLYYRCGTDTKNRNSLSENCTFTCSVAPGRSENAAFIRFPIPKYDGTKNVTSVFSEEIWPFNFHTDPDKVKNFRVELNKTNNREALIYFTQPRGYFDDVYIECFAYNKNCTNSTYYLKGSMSKSCKNCSHIAISSVVAGVEYECWANTSKLGGSSIKYKAINFNTTLQPVLYEKIWSPNTAHISLNVTAQSDFDNIESVCKADDRQNSVCSDIRISSIPCSTRLSLTLNNTRGCDYQCFFLTKKQGYADARSETFSVSIPPPKPKIISSVWGARYISVEWTIDEPTYIDSFSLVVNGTPILIPDRRARSFNYTDNIHPNRPYHLYVEVVSNTKVQSDEIFDQTADDVPEKPRHADVEAKIIVSNDNRNLTLTQYPISIDPSLFSNENGNLINYVVYVRQDMKKTMEEPDLDGTYANAINNPSKDYLVTEIPLSSSKRDDSQTRTLAQKISLILGNETHCTNVKICNGPLKTGTRYKVLVGSCTSAGCTYVLSKEFKTKSMSRQKRNGSLMWLIAIPIVVILFILGGLIVWKRKVIQNYCSNRHGSTTGGVNAEFIPVGQVAR